MALFENHQRFKGNLLNELCVPFNENMIEKITGGFMLLETLVLFLCLFKDGSVFRHFLR